jgi:hypothetical protein
MQIGTGAEFLSGLGDARVATLSWIANDLRVDFLLPDRDSTHSLVFRYVTRLKIDLDYGEHIGEPLLFDATVKVLETRQLAVALTFGAAPNGEIVFECNCVDVAAA